MMTERPDGSTATNVGWFLVVIGGFAIFLAAGAETVEGLVLGAAVANLGIGLGVLLLSLGYLVRAIYFLPGREIDSENVEATPMKEAGAFCDWCHLWIDAPGNPCSASDEATICADIKTALEGQGLAEACQHELVRRGYIDE